MLCLSNPPVAGMSQALSCQIITNFRIQSLQSWHCLQACSCHCISQNWFNSYKWDETTFCHYFDNLVPSSRYSADKSTGSAFSDAVLPHWVSKPFWQCSLHILPLHPLASLPSDRGPSHHCSVRSSGPGACSKYKITLLHTIRSSGPVAVCGVVGTSANFFFWCRPIVLVNLGG